MGDSGGHWLEVHLEGAVLSAHDPLGWCLGSLPTPAPATCQHQRAGAASSLGPCPCLHRAATVHHGVSPARVGTSAGGVGTATPRPGPGLCLAGRTFLTLRQAPALRGPCFDPSSLGRPFPSSSSSPAWCGARARCGPSGTWAARSSTRSR